MNKPALLLLGILVAGCDAPITPLDGGTPDPITPPDAPIFTCPAGWRSIALHGASICEPWAEGAAPRCADDELALVGQAESCQPVSPCPTGDWPEVVPDAAIYARVGALDGDGTRERPFGTLAEAASAAQRASVPIVLGPGEYTAGTRLIGIPGLYGVCPARTWIHATGLTGVAIEVQGTVEIASIRLTGDFLGLAVSADSNVVLRGVIADGGTSGIRMRERSVLDGDRVLVRGPSTLNPRVHQPAIQLGDQAHVTLRHATLIGPDGGVITPAAVDLPPPTFFGTLVLEDTAILDSGYAVAGPIEATLTRVAIERGSTGTILSGGHTVTLTDVLFRDLGEVAYQGGSGGILAGDSSAALHRVAMVRVRGNNIALLDRDEVRNTVTGEDVFIAETDDVVGPTFEAHIAVLAEGFGAGLELHRVHLAELIGSAFQSAEATVVVSDVRIEGARVSGNYGRGFEAVGGRLTVDRAFIRADDFGVFAGDGAQVAITDVEIEGGLGIALQCSPDGPCTPADTHLSAQRAAVHGVRRAGVLLYRASADLTDVTIDGVRSLVSPIEPSLLPGIGLAVLQEGRLHGEGIVIHDVEGAGVMAFGPVTVEMSDLSVSVARALPCESCGGVVYGDGVFWVDGATMSLDGFSIENAERAGLAAASEYTAPILGRGVLRNCHFGVLTPSGADPRPYGSLTFDGVAVRADVLDLRITLDPTELLVPRAGGNGS